MLLMNLSVLHSNIIVQPSKFCISNYQQIPPSTKAEKKPLGKQNIVKILDKYRTQIRIHEINQIEIYLNDNQKK